MACIVAELCGRGDGAPDDTTAPPLCTLLYVVCVFSLQAFRTNKDNSLYFHYDKPHSFKVGGWL